MCNSKFVVCSIYVYFVVRNLKPGFERVGVVKKNTTCFFGGEGERSKNYLQGVCVGRGGAY